MNKVLTGICLFTMWIGQAQESFPVNGVPDKRPEIYAFTNATLFIDFQTKVENATLIIEGSKVKATGTNVAIPKGAIVTDLKGKYVYPAIVEPYSHFGLPEVKPANFEGKPQYDSKKVGPYGWNEAINAEYRSASEFRYNTTQAEDWRKVGVGTVLTHKPDGIVRGTSMAVALSDKSAQEAVLATDVSTHYSFNKGASKQAYPNSIMGMVALLRQTHYDARWYASSKPDQTNLTLQTFNEIQKLPQVFEAGNKLRVLLADQIGDEFGIQYIIKGSGDEYQRATEIKATNARMIIPLDFPAAYDVEDPFKAQDVSLTDMKHWELAPYNARLLSEKGVTFAFTTSGLKSSTDLWKNVRKIIDAGLSENEALKALTYTPSSFFGLEKKVGALKPGMVASFFITDESIFSEKSKILESWVQGSKYSYSELDPVDHSGMYTMVVKDSTYKLEISGTPGSHSAKILKPDSTSIKVKMALKENRVSISYQPDTARSEVRLSGWVEKGKFGGIGFLEDGITQISWSASRTGDLEKKEEEKKGEKEDVKSEPGSLIYPFVAYGWTEKPAQETLLFKNATVWTMEEDAVPAVMDVLVKSGKISAVGQNLSAPDAKVVDGTGKHLSPGIIDEHSHIALSSVNEGSSAITAEVRMYDALDSEDVDIYRQLAGGVTTAQLLHGSANPVGGQSALIKFRWGEAPDKLKVGGADGYIKFALGENVKQTNWGENYTSRFPQTRMGVEQVYVDGFTRAKEYGIAKARYEALSPKLKASTPAPRKDLQLETLLEIINGQRFITCHSYVQSEINMLMKVAEDFNFRVNTFTHILEGYKVADKMASHGAGASTFADWWAYKFEVKDAIPYNAALMTKSGVVTAINSDDGEMARRLNQEAAKSIMYGGLTEVDAMKLVTINPAKLLHLDNRIGSIKVGKDADVVLWSGNPLSIYSRPEMTLVDGIVYFSLEKDQKLQAEIAAERARLITKMINEKNGGAPTQPAAKKEKHYFHCEDMIMEGVTLTDTENE